jgi:serine/threonine protein kinase
MSASQLIASRFEISDLEEDLLGRGGMGDVYRATDTQTGQPVAIKVLKPDVVASNPDIVARFIREGQALRQLNHPNIVKMVTAVEEEGQHYLIMEYVGGGSLQDLLEATRPDRFQENLSGLPITRVVEIGLEVADALIRAHHLGIIHRDLKPANVLLAEDGTPRLTDFGLAHVADSPRLTQTGILDAAEKLAETPAEEHTVRGAHAAYSVAFLASRETLLRGMNRKQALAEIRAEADNIRTGWGRAVARGRIEEIEQSLETLAGFCRIRGWY